MFIKVYFLSKIRYKILLEGKKIRLLEYESKNIFAKFGVPLADYIVIQKGDSIERKTRDFSFPATIKSQIAIGGRKKAAIFLKNNVDKPIIAYITGKSVPEGKRMGHAGAIISGVFGSAQGKIKALKNAAALISDSPWDVPKMINEIL